MLHLIAGCPLLTARLPCGTGATRYRCFLPDLTEFTVPPCTGPNYQQSTSSVRHGGEGGIRTPGTLIRGTHDFQSCTFNRSVTSPAWKVEHLRALPCLPSTSMSPKCLHGAILGHFLHCLVNLTQQIIRGKDEVSSFWKGLRATLFPPKFPNFMRHLSWLD